MRFRNFEGRGTPANTTTTNGLGHRSPPSLKVPQGDGGLSPQGSSSPALPDWRRMYFEQKSSGEAYRAAFDRLLVDGVASILFWAALAFCAGAGLAWVVRGAI